MMIVIDGDKEDLTFTQIYWLGVYGHEKIQVWYTLFVLYCIENNNFFPCEGPCLYLLTPSVQISENS